MDLKNQKRTIKFRGKNLKGQWHYGLLCHDKTKDSDYEWFISNSAGKPYAFGAIPETIGQFTGLHDKNGKEIYEGDLLQDFRRTFIYECVYRENGAFEFQNKTTLNFTLLHYIWDNEVIGNVFENADLVKL